MKAIHLFSSPVPPSLLLPPSLPLFLPPFHFLVGQFRDLQNTLLVLPILSDAVPALICFLSFSSLLTNEKKVFVRGNLITNVKPPQGTRLLRAI